MTLNKLGIGQLGFDPATQIELDGIVGDHTKLASGNLVGDIVQNSNQIGTLSKRITRVDLVQDFGAVGGDVTKDTQAFLNAINYALQQSRNVEIYLPPLDFLINQTLTINHYAMSVRSEGATLDFSGLPDGNIAIQVINTMPAVGDANIRKMYKAINGLSGFTMFATSNKNAGANGNTKTALYYDQSGNGSNSATQDNTQAENISISDFGTGVFLGRNTWCNRFKKIYFNKCTLGADISDYGISDASNNGGENEQFDSCTWDSCVNNVHVHNAIADVHFKHCSLDYNNGGYIMQIDNGQVFMDECHIENNPNNNSSQAPFLLKNDSYLSISKSWILQVLQGQSLNAQYNYFIECDNTSKCTINQSKIDYLYSKSTYLFYGNVVGHHNKVKSGALNGKQISNQNGLLNGSFGNNDLNIDDITIMEDVSSGGTVPITTSGRSDRVSGTEISLAYDATDGNNAAGCLQVNKLTADSSGTAMSFVIAVPLIGKSPAISVKFNYKVSTTLTNNLAVYTSYSKCGYNANGVPILENPWKISATNPLGGGLAPSTTWSQMILNRYNDAPSWATHILLYIAIQQNATAFTLYVDDVEISQI